MQRQLWGHSPDTLALMWKTAFTDLEGKEFTERHLKIDVSVRVQARAYNGNETIPYLDWSVVID